MPTTILQTYLKDRVWRALPFLFIFLELLSHQLLQEPKFWYRLLFIPLHSTEKFHEHLKKTLMDEDCLGLKQKHKFHHLYRFAGFYFILPTYWNRGIRKHLHHQKCFTKHLCYHCMLKCNWVWKGENRHSNDLSRIQLTTPSAHLPHLKTLTRQFLHKILLILCKCLTLRK